MKSWYDEFIAGRCNEAQASYWKPKAAEEFYAIADDRFELRNLISEPQRAASIARMRLSLREEILTSRDTGFIPEGMFVKLAGDKTIYDYAHSDAYPLERIVDMADIASDGRSEHLPALINALSDPHPIVGYWAATGCLILKEKAAPAKAMLRERLKDEWADVRVIAAEVIGLLGEPEAAAATIKDVLRSGNRYESLAALNTLDLLRSTGIIPLSVAREMVQDLKLAEPADRIAAFILE